MPESGNILVKVARIGERSEEVALPAGATIRDALDAVDIYLEKGEEIQINGAVASEDTVLRDGDRVFIVPPTTTLEMSIYKERCTLIHEQKGMAYTRYCGLSVNSIVA